MRAMTPDDIDAVLAIEQAVQLFPWSHGNFADALKSGYVCRVAEEVSGEICGYALLMPGVDEAELLNIGVAADQQRKGIGRTILLEMLSRVREMNLKHVFLEVAQSNQAALELYRSIGFKKIGVRRAYYHHATGSMDALTMACELQGECHG